MHLFYLVGQIYGEFLGTSICLSVVHWHVWVAIHLSICPSGHLGGITLYDRHPDVCQYNYLFTWPVVDCRLTIVYRDYLSVATCLFGLHPYLVESTSFDLIIMVLIWVTTLETRCYTVFSNRLIVTIAAFLCSCLLCLRILKLLQLHLR